MTNSNRRTRKGVRNNWWQKLNIRIQDYNMVHGYDTAIRWKKYPKMTGGSRDPYLAFMGIQEDNENSTNTNSLTNNSTNYSDPSYNQVVYTVDKIVTVGEKRYQYCETEDGMNIILRRSNAEVCFHIRLQNDPESTGKK